MIPPWSALAAPWTPLPPPHGVIGTPTRLASLTISATCSVVLGLTATSGLLIDRPAAVAATAYHHWSLAYGPSAAGDARTLSAPTISASEAASAAVPISPVSMLYPL